jgi:hypothetical protein
LCFLVSGLNVSGFKNPFNSELEIYKRANKSF